MKEEYLYVIATKHRAAGNESVGSMWTETRTFKKSTPVSEIMEWAKNKDGHLILTIDENMDSN